MASKQHADFDFDSRKHWRFEAGMNSPYGQVSFRCLTNNGSGHGWYESGVNKEDFQLAASGSSIECIGSEIKRERDAAQDALHPAKWIKAKHGDIVFEADDGDIVLIADNIKLRAKGIRDDLSGDIQMEANKAVKIDAPDIRVVGSNLRLTARYSFTISAKVVGGIVAGVLNMASAADFGSSIPLSALTALKDALEAE